MKTNLCVRLALSVVPLLLLCLCISAHAQVYATPIPSMDPFAGQNGYAPANMLPRAEHPRASYYDAAHPPPTLPPGYNGAVDQSGQAVYNAYPQLPHPFVGSSYHAFNPSDTTTGGTDTTTTGAQLYAMVSNLSNTVIYYMQQMLPGAFGLVALVVGVGLVISFAYFIIKKI